MKHRIIIVAVAAFVVISAAGWLIAQGEAPQKPVRHTSVHIDGGTVPDSLEALWTASTVVVEATVVDARPANETVLTAGGTEPATFVKTVYTFEIVRVIKADGNVGPQGTTIEVQRIGGVVDRGAYIEEQADSDFPKFKPQSRYLLFLMGRDVTPYWPASGADSAFEVFEQRVVPLGKGRASQLLAKFERDKWVTLLFHQKGGR